MMPRNAIYASSLLAAATQAVGIAPCLIIIRVALGVDTRDVFSSIAVLSNNHTLAISSRRRTVQDLSDLENNVLDSEVALLGTEMRENSDSGEEGSDEPRLRVRVRNQLPSQIDDDGKYIAIANHAGEEENSDSNTQSTISNSAYDYEDRPIPELTPNAQQVEFARLDTAVLGWDGVLKVINPNTPEET
ncbi:hypothetical protein F5050DRAFT_320931 [Lentinula boryana]|uniref:Uncharacterized protein n=1 Tax=Lentinula boryana TaxID=40481 RepID=A0ABQ8Q9V7_9AGAR|nr:hypothetical protein F5050DRAFT_320931 [Lentinula boryana]